MPLSPEVHPSTSDSALVQAARLGDRRAFAELLVRHRGTLIALCRRFVGGQAVEDIVQETSVAALLGIDGLREPARFGSWLAGIGLNMCRRWWKERDLRTSWDAAGPERQAGGPWADPSELATEREVARRVRLAVRGLPPGQREAVLLFYFAGLTHREVAIALDINVGAVKARLHKARAGLRPRLQPLWKEEDVDGAQVGMVRMKPADVLRLPADGERLPEFVVVLEEVDGTRQLPIWVGQSEATWLALTLEGTKLPRPGPYILAAALLSELGSRVSEVRIERLVESTYYAVVVAEREGHTIAIDARPSDALNLAALTGAPVLAAADVVAGSAMEEGRPPYERLRNQVGAGRASRSATVAADALKEWKRAIEEIARGEE